MDADQIPTELKAHPQWVTWRTEDRDGSPTKVPLDPTTSRYASVTTPATWSDYTTAVEQYQARESVDGLGFVFRDDGPYAGIDLDDCRDPVTGDVAEWAVEIIQQLESYTEWSPSGTGVHIIIEGAVPEGGNRSGKLEMYDSERYFTVTGDRIPGAPTTVEERGDELAAIHQEYIAGTDQESEAAIPADRPEVTASNAELLEKAMNAANGDKFRRLWLGDISGYDSHSEADQALATMLAFYTGGDPHRIKKLFDQSGLVREKWRDRPDYRERTIHNAIQYCSVFYEGSQED